jgi:hypothetical protein
MKEIHYPDVCNRCGHIICARCGGPVVILTTYPCDERLSICTCCGRLTNDNDNDNDSQKESTIKGE